MSTITYRELAAEIGVPDEDVDAFCKLLPDMGYPEEGLSREEHEEVLRGYTSKGGVYAGSPLEEGALERRLEYTEAAADAAAVAERLYLMPRTRWRECLVPATVVFAFRRLAAIEAVE